MSEIIQKIQNKKFPWVTLGNLILTKLTKLLISFFRIFFIYICLLIKNLNYVLFFVQIWMLRNIDFYLYRFIFILSGFNIFFTYSQFGFCVRLGFVFLSI